MFLDQVFWVRPHFSAQDTLFWKTIIPETFLDNMACYSVKKEDKVTPEEDNKIIVTVIVYLKIIFKREG